MDGRDDSIRPFLRGQTMLQGERAIFTNMCMIRDGAGRVLVQDRTDCTWPGVTFPGGHVEPGEAFFDAVVREVREETGLTVEGPVLCGVKQFQTDDGARYVVLLYRAVRFTGELKSSQEGEVFWVEPENLKNYRLAGGFDQMLRAFYDDSLSEMWYDPQKEQWRLIFV